MGTKLRRPVRDQAARAASFGLPLLLTACAAAPPPQPKHPSANDVFEIVAPGVVAIVNDDTKDREAEIKELERSLGDESHAPKEVIDVSLHKERMPDGTGFLIEGGNVVTAAHVVHRPDRLKITTRKGQTVEAELVVIDEIRDIAILHPKEPLKDVPVIPLANKEPIVGQPIWTLGHTGRASWSLGWGMSSGIASGTADMLGARIVLFDAPVYPGFSGGPVVTLDDMGNPRIVGINHAILFTGTAGYFAPIGSISSGIMTTELKDVIAGKAHPLATALGDYAKEHKSKVYADLFITDRVSVSRDANDQPVASILGNTRALDASAEDTRIPTVAMIFGLGEGEQEIDFEAQDPTGQVVARDIRYTHVGDHQRVSFVGSTMHFGAKTHGRYMIIAKQKDKEIGRSMLNLSLEDDDEELIDDGDTDVVEDGKPDVDVVVAQSGNDDPLALGGIRAAWAEKSFPRRVGFSFFARATRGWAGTNVTVSAFVLDETGAVVGRTDGCYFSELRPEHTWSCVGSGSDPALVRKEGRYDIVFAVNNRPVAWWPMEAAIKKEESPGTDMQRWLREMHRMKTRRAKAAPPVAKAAEKPAEAPTPAKPALKGAPAAKPKGK